MEKLLIKDLESWIDKQELLYASTTGIRFFVRVKAAPNFPRYIVIDTKLSIEHLFTKKSSAIKKFNELIKK